MSRIAAVLALVAALLLAPPSASAARSGGWDPVERLEGTPSVVVEVGKKPRLYFPLSGRRPLEVPVEGPARVRIVSRAVVAAETEGSVSYTIRIVAGGKTLGEARTESSKAPNARRRDGKGALCKSRTLAVDVPAGTHRLLVQCDGDPPLLVRLLLASPRRDPGVKLVSLTPMTAAKSVTVVEGELMIPYYTTRTNTPVVFRIVGPTSLELTSRLDYETTMRGPQRYRLSIKVDAGPPREEVFTTTKAASASYSESKARIPSKLDRVVVPIGEGAHAVSVVLIAPAKGTAQIHGRIPQPSIGNEE
ncbi:MAG TPA: hypothetical protein VFU59_06400 [Candidatus Eisenbacteria bacterium]|nr:hypothetical protein [Candidatus Eisenbacteria bacterium]